jgi:phosphatidylglycerophosphatase A
VSVRRAALWLATGLRIGFLPLAPATWASLAVAILLVPFAGNLTAWGLGGAILVLFPLSVWASGETEKTLGHDAKPIVIDEVVGMLVSVWAVPVGSRPVLALGLAFFLFRIFDVWKPFPIRRSQKLPGGWGVVVDDVLAGVATNLVLRLALRWVQP